MGAFLRVLLADDTPEMRMLLRVTLEGDGRFVVTGEATDGVEAVEMTEDQRPDAVILDLAMPIMDGLQAIPRILEVSPGTRIVVLSGFDAHQMADEAMKRGAHAYFEKGKDMEDLIEWLAEQRPELEGPEPTPAVPHGAALEDIERADYEDYRLDVVLSTLIHELQTPATVIKGFAATLRSAVERMDQRSILAGAAAIERSVDNLQSLIRSLADVRAIDSGKLRLELERLDLGHVVRDTLKDLRMITDPHPVALEAEDPVPLHIDSTRIRQVVTNLLSNAAKFSPDDAPIEVAVSRADVVAQVAVTDHGPGIPQQRMKQLFRKFSRLGSNAPGTGLGLYVSRGIARAHGGDLVVFSEEGAGCRFELHLPLRSN